MFKVTGMTQPGKKDSRRKRDSNPGLLLSRRAPYHKADEAVSGADRAVTAKVTLNVVRAVEVSAQWFVGCLLNVPAACKCISGTDLLRQFYVLPH